MQASSIGIGLCGSLLVAAFADWSLVSLLYFIAFLVVQYQLKRQGQKSCASFCVALVLSVVVFLVGATVAVSWAILGSKWKISNTLALEILGFDRIVPADNVGKVLSFFAPTLLVAVVASFGLYYVHCRRFREHETENSVTEIRAAVRSFALPIVQVIAGSVFPCWAALPYFICSCTGLFYWGVTSHFLGLSWGWKPLLIYNAVHVFALYIRQLPIHLPSALLDFVDYLGLFTISSGMEWVKALQAVSILGLYILLCLAVGDLEDIGSQGNQALPISLMDDDNFHESLLHPAGESRGRRWSDSDERRMLAFKEAAVCFFTCGFPICLVALVCWSFKFESFCALVLLAYVGFILCAFPSLFLLRRLNGVLLAFVLLWGLSTYIFNASFTIMNSRFDMDTAIWQTIGLWRYSSPGLFIMAQFALGVLVATDLFAGNSILDHPVDLQDHGTVMNQIDERQDGWILMTAVAAWCIQRSSHVLSLILIFIVGLRNGLVHAFYMAFFVAYLLSPAKAKKTRRLLMLYCELHIGILYVLQLEWISRIIGKHERVVRPILSQLGIWNKANFRDYLAVAGLLGFSAIQKHGIKVISSLSAAAQTASYSPFVFSVYRSGLEPCPQENWITRRLAAFGGFFRASYRSMGTYIVYATVLAVVYATRPNFVSFGYLLLLVVWIIGRQVLGKTEWPLWTPLFIYSCLVFVARYIISVFPDLQHQLGKSVRLYEDLGFDPDGSLLSHLWDSLAILGVLQLYRYERCQPASEGETHGLFVGTFERLDFLKRLLILHSGKILSIAVFYASISPVGGFGLVYLLVLVCTCTVPKTSAMPAQFYAVYTGLLLVLDYGYQMFGKETGMDPHDSFCYWLGLRLYDKGAWSIGSGSLSRILVLVACMLQYCCFQWLSKMPAPWRRSGELCALFYDSYRGYRDQGSREPVLMKTSSSRRVETSSPRRGNLSPSLSKDMARETKKWNRRAMILKQEKYEAQWLAFTGWVKYLVEHVFTIYGVEVTMLALLVGGFAVLNIFSLVYVLVLALCILLPKRFLRLLWPFFVALFACILVGEYAALARPPPSWKIPPSNKHDVHCHDCWKSSSTDLGFCWRCWLGAVDDRQMLVAYYMVFMISYLQLSALGLSDTASFHAARLAATRKLAWSEISYETAEQWTWLDHLRFSFYRHLLHVVLLLVFITGTLQYDLLHLGYLAFSMVFFRMRTTIMNRRNTIFRFLRLYNFSLIVASLIFQAPLFAYIDGRDCTAFSIFGLYKYDYGFRITARSALVDITIFCLVGLQTRVFRTTEFEQVLRYLAAEQVEARANAQECKAAWKKEQLQRIREVEDRKRQRRVQVDKMKLEMLPMQLRLDVLNSDGKFRETFPPFKRSQSPPKRSHVDDAPDSGLRRRLVNSFSDSELFEHFEDHGLEETSRRRRRRLSLTPAEAQIGTVSDQLGLDSSQNMKSQLPSPAVKKSSLTRQSFLSAVPLIGDSVAQVHNFGNKALANLVGLLNLEQTDSEDNFSVEEDGKVDVDEEITSRSMEPVPSGEPEAAMKPSTPPGETRRRLSMICSYLWSKIIVNTDIVCYVLFVLVYVWNFSLLTLVFPASIFLYGLLVNPAPSQLFWSVMLIYTEFSILIQYMYQIIVNHCGHDDIPLWLKKFGVTGRNVSRSFVGSVLPLFLVYLATLVQSSIKAREGEWMFVTEGVSLFSSRRVTSDGELESNAMPRPSLKAKLCSSWRMLVGVLVRALRRLIRCWRSLTNGSEVPPHFVQVTLSVSKWPEDGIQPERIESAFNRLLSAVGRGHSARCSSVRVESLEPSQESSALAVLEVIHAAPPPGSSVLLSSLTPASDVAAEIMKAKEEGWLEDIDFPYPISSVIAGGKKQVDLYAYIFGTDLLAFLYVTLFYQAFIKNSPEFLDVYQLEDQFPKEFVFVLMTLFFLIVLDRVLYLSACAIGKVFYYFSTLVLYTSYVTSFVWGMELQQKQNVFFQLLPLRGFYLLKALSLYLQAVQLRNGLPRKSTLYGQFLMRKVSNMSWLGFRIYRALPFLFELRCVLDWSCTTTALSMYDWLKLEDIYASLFLVQCDIKLARENHRIGEKRGVWVKFCNGLCLFIVLICVIWAPMLIYSSGNPTNFVNDILEARSQIRIQTVGGSFTIFETQLCKIQRMEDIMATGIDIDQNHYLASFDAKDVQLVCCQPDANSLWLVPPPTLKNLINSFEGTVSLGSSWDFHRERPKNKEVVTFLGQFLEVESLRGVLNGSYDSVAVANLYPKYFRLTSAGEARVLEQTDTMVSGNLTLNREAQPWWSFTRADASEQDGCGGVAGPSAIAVSEEVPKGLIGDTLSKFNIWSLYITFVLAVGRFIRLQCADLRMRIPYENFPTCDRLIAICEDIYAARAEGELELEEGLFWTLVKIYRSPHILIEYTKAE